MNKFIRLFNTVKYLKVKQIYFRLFYFARTRLRQKVGFEHKNVVPKKVASLKLDDSISSNKSYEDNLFTFLNLSHSSYYKDLDWNDARFGKLWTYNRSYFDYLNQKNIPLSEGLELMYSFVEQIKDIKDGLEPFPISLRGLNWIKYITTNKIEDKVITDSLYQQYYMLLDHLEYHLLGNHLLENGFSLLFGAYYYEDEKLYSKAKEILQEELSEQILDDGAHFELSPMYHQIMLFRVLDCINLIKNNDYKNQELLVFLEKKASLMLSWLDNVTFKNGEIPLLNDSAKAIAPTSKELFEYANKLNLKVEKVELKSSGYRTVSNDRYECIVDVGNIGPDYIPGHAHSDTFSFELCIHEKPFIVDTGLSTYETNTRRTKERSTSSHNTVEINAKDQSEVWGGFRVANRAKITDLEESKNSITATHDGYKKDGVLHTRSWKFEEDKIIIEDRLSKESESIARIHFHPDINEDQIKKHIILKDIDFKITTYKYAPEFNKLIDALVIEISFKQNLTTEIQL